MSKILCISDMSGVGKVALSAMIPVLSHFGHEIDNCPTALVSNTLDYGIFHILDTTDHMEKSFEAWKQLNFEFDCIVTGFLTNFKQSELIADYIRSFKKKPLVLVDPIMGDDGQMYPGLDRELISVMKNMITIADIIIPNFTEAALLVNQYTEQTEVSEEEAADLIQRLKDLHAKSILVTSCVSSEKKEHFVLGYDDQNKQIFRLNYELIPVRFPGTGDVFAGALCAHILNGESLKESCQKAMNLVYDLIYKNQDKEDKLAGRDLEKLLS